MSRHAARRPRSKYFPSHRLIDPLIDIARKAFFIFCLYALIILVVLVMH